MKKIIFVIERLSTGGAERVVTALANEICKLKDYEVTIITYNPKEENEYKLSNEVKRIALENKSNSRFIRIYSKYSQLKEIIKKIHPYCVFSLAIPKTNVVLMASLLNRSFPLIISERNDPSRFPEGKIMKKIRNYIYKKADGLVFQTTGAKEYFNKIIKNKTAIICNPITSTLPKPFIGKREHKIVNFCRIEPQKNLKMLIDAFNIVKNSYSDYTLEIYGEGSQKEELKEYVKKLSLEEKVFFMPYSNDIHEKIRKATLFVSSSNFEGISNSMLEAMCIGLPTICTDCPPGGAKSVIINEKNGFLVPVGDVEKMANSMCKILGDEKLQTMLSINSSKLSEHINVSSVAKKWLEFTERVMVNEH